MIKTVFKNFIIVFLGSNLQSAWRMLLHVYIAKKLGPAIYGHYILMMSIVSYFRVLNFGIIDGMLRQIPYYIGSKKKDRIEHVKSEAFWGSIFFPMFLALTVAFFSRSFLEQTLFLEENSLKISWCLMVVVGIFASSSSYFPSLAVATKRFKMAQIYRNYLSFFALTLALPLVHFFGLVGAMASWICSYFILFIIGAKKEGLPAFVINIKEFRVLLNIGIPLMVIDLIGGLYWNADKFMIGAFLGTKHVGYYGIAVLVIGFLHSLPGLLAGVLYPDMSMRFGRNNDPQDVYSLWWKPVFIFSIIIPVCLPIIYFALEGIVVRFLPQYISGLIAGKIAVVGVFYFMLEPFTGSALISIGKQRDILIFAFCGLIIAVGLNFLALRWGMGISGVAAATVVTFLLSYLARNFVLMKAMGFSFQKSLKKFIELNGVFLYMGMLLFVLEIFLKTTHLGWQRIGLLLLVEIFLLVFISFIPFYKNQVMSLVISLLKKD